MAICKNCGVDLGEGNDNCPLCKPAEQGTVQIVSPADLFNLSKIVKTRTLYEITMLLLVSGVIVTIAIDFVFVRGMGWSLFTTTCIGYLISLVSFIYFFRRKPYFMIGSTLAATLLFLWLIDLLTGNHGWFRTVGAPLVPLFSVRPRGNTLLMLRILHRTAQNPISDNSATVAQQRNRGCRGWCNATPYP